MLAIFNVIFIAFLAGIIIFIRSYRAKKKLHLKQLEEVDLLHKQELLKTQIEIQTQTMSYIGREIHDNVGQKLTLSSLYLQQLPTKDQTPETIQSIKEINTIVDESLDDLRRLSKSLTDDAIQNFSIYELIKSECEKIDNLKAYTVSFNSNLKNKRHLYEVKSVLLRVTQEFIQNSIKHAKCKNIDVSLHENNNKLQLTLKDDGKGFDIKNFSSNGIGLKNIEKRIKIINGVSNLKSDILNGTEFNIEISL